MQKHSKNQNVMFILFFIFLTSALVACNGDGAKFGFGLGFDESQTDDDNDGVIAADDNCDAVANADQADTDGDGAGDACDDGTTGDDDDDSGDDTCTATVNILYYADSDLDGYGTSDSTVATKTFTDCDDATATSGYATSNTDCDDASDLVNPGAAETYGDGVDQNCVTDPAYLSAYDYVVNVDGMGTSQTTTSYTYNSSGEVLTYEHDQNAQDGDGIETSYTNEYDSENHNTNIFITSYTAGVASGWEKKTYANYDDQDNYLLRTQYTCDATWSCTLVDTSVYTYTYDEQHNPTLMTQSVYFGTSTTATISVEQVSTYTYDAEGHILTEATDTDNDGSVDLNYSYVYDADGNVTADTFGNPTVNNASESTWVNGLRMTYTHYSVSGSTYTFSYRITYTYDEHGTVTSSSRDTDDDGIANDYLLTATKIEYTNE